MVDIPILATNLNQDGIVKDRQSTLIAPSEGEPNHALFSATCAMGYIT